MNEDFNVLTRTLQIFEVQFGAGFSNLWDDIQYLIAFFIVLEIFLFGMWWALGKDENILSIFKKILFLGFWLWIATQLPFLASVFADSLIQAGLTAGGGPGAGNPCLFNDPSCIAERGSKVVAPLMNQASSAGTFDVATKLGMWISALLILIAFFIVAVQIFVALIEFYILVALCGIFIPFGFNEKTKFLAEKAIAALISSGVKLMVLAFVLTVAEPILTDLEFAPGEIPWEAIWVVLLVSWTIAYLAWTAPGMAAGLLSGSPTLTAGGVAQGALVTGAAAGVAVGGGLAAMKAGASAGGAAGQGAISGATRLGSAASTGAQMGAAGQSSALGKAAGGIGGAVKASAGLVSSSMGAPIASAAKSAGQSIQANARIGARSGYSSTGGKMTSGMKAADASDRAATSSAAKSTPLRGGSAVPTWAKRAASMSRRVGDSGGGGGFSVSL